MNPKEQYPPLWSLWSLVFFVVMLGAFVWRNHPWEKASINQSIPVKTKGEPNLSPPATAKELAKFRIVTNQFGTMAIQQLVDVEWVLRPNRWSNTNDCRWDMEWWIEHSRVKRIEEQSEWKARGTNAGAQFINSTVTNMPKGLAVEDERHPKVGPASCR